MYYRGEEKRNARFKSHCIILYETIFMSKEYLFIIYASSFRHSFLSSRSNRYQALCKRENSIHINYENFYFIRFQADSRYVHREFNHRGIFIRGRVFSLIDPLDLFRIYPYIPSECLKLTKFRWLRRSVDHRICRKCGKSRFSHRLGISIVVQSISFLTSVNGIFVDIP